jgi:hypothetical protein
MGPILRNYWAYSIGCGIAWAVLLALGLTIWRSRGPFILLVFVGYFICWVSGTIARYTYPPPKVWTSK